MSLGDGDDNDAQRLITSRVDDDYYDDGANQQPEIELDDHQQEHHDDNHDGHMMINSSSNGLLGSIINTTNTSKKEKDHNHNHNNLNHPHYKHHEQSLLPVPLSEIEEIVEEQYDNHGHYIEEKLTNHYSLKTYDQIPHYLQGNEFIKTGYRVNFTFKLCFKSIFRLHNETLNIWTHLIGTFLFFILMFVTLLSILDNPSTIDKLVFVIFFLCVQAQMLFSTLFHTFCSVSGKFYAIFARCDYIGISTCIVGSYIAPLYYLFKCHEPYGTVYIIGVSVLGIIGVSVSSIPFFQTYRFRVFRAVFFIIFGLYILIPLPHIWHLESFAYIWPILWRLMIMGSIYIAGAIIYSLRYPEKACPGCFDLGFSSHPIWHLFVITAALFQMYNCIYAFNHYNSVCPVK